MNKYFLALIISISVLFIFSCNQKEKKSNKTELSTIDLSKKETDSIGAKLFNQKCMICHNHEGKVDSTMIAPPFFQVKDRYLRASFDKEDFIQTMTYWVKNPTEENILMRGTIGHFEVMPYLAYSDEDIAKIVNYVYENDMEKPKWFDAHQAKHQQEQRAKGRGRGQGRRLQDNKN